MQNTNLKMLSYFENSIKSKLNNEYKDKTSLDIITNLSEYKKYIPFNSKLNNKLLVLKKIEQNLNNTNILTNKNINKDLINTNNIMIPRKKEIINNQINKNLITNINLPLNIIGKPALNEKNINYLNLITMFNPEIGKVKNTVFNFNLINNKLLKNVYTILDYSFKSMSSLISKPYFYIYQDKIIIHLFFYNKVLPKFKLFRKKWKIIKNYHS